MEVLFVGLGSIGTRHLRNLFQVAKEKGIEVQADALRSSMRPLAADVEGLLRAQYVSYDQLGHKTRALAEICGLDVIKDVPAQPAKPTLK